MIRIVFIFLLLMVSIGIGLQLSHDPGYVLIAINHWTIETTLLIAIMGLLLIIISLHSLLTLLNRLIHLPSNYQQWRIKRRALKAQSTTRKGLIEFSEGYWSAAQNHLIKALPDTDTPLFNYLTAARAAQEMGNSQLRDDYLREAQQSVPDAKIAVELTQAQLQLADQQWEQALATLRHLQDLAPNHPYVLKLLMQLYQEVRDWPQLIALLPELQRKKVISSQTFDNLQRQACLQAMLDLVRVNHSEALDALVKTLPKSLKYDSDLIACYTSFLVNHQQYTKAELLLRQSLRQIYHERLIAIYGSFYLNDKQLIFAESLQKKHADSAQLYLCLGRLCRHKQLWGKAKTYFEKSLHLQPSPAAYAAIGELFIEMGDKEAALKAWQQGLMLAVDNP